MQLLKRGLTSFDAVTLAFTEVLANSGVYRATNTGTALNGLYAGRDADTTVWHFDFTGGADGTYIGQQTATDQRVGSNIAKGVALASFPFLMTDSTTHLPATGKTVTVTRSIDGGAFGAGTLSAVTEVSSGIYRVDFAAADMAGKSILLLATATGCDTTFERISTQP